MATTVKEALHPDFAGLAIMLFISQIGGKLIVEEVHNRCGEALDAPIVKMVVIYSVLYLGTKDKFASLVWTILIALAWNVFIKGPGRNYCKRKHDGTHSYSLT